MIFGRGEFKLTNLALSQAVLDSKKIDIVDDPEVKIIEKVNQEKVRIALFYYKFLLNTLEDCLTKFCRKDVEPYL